MRVEMNYNQLRYQVSDPVHLRVALVKCALEQGVKPAARTFGTSPQTVRLWLKRYQTSGLAGLKERSHRPQHAHPQTTPAALEAEVVALRRAQPGYGQDRIAAILTDQGTPISGKTVRKILQRHGLLTSASALQAPRQLRAPTTLQPFEQLQIDVIDLWTEEEVLNASCAPALRYEFVLRDVATGACFIAYAATLQPPNIRCFVQRVITHLWHFGFRPRTLHVEDESTWAFYQLDQALTTLLPGYGVTPNLLPPSAAPRSWSVRAFQQTLEKEFYRAEMFEGEDDLLAKAASFGRWFNLERPDRYRRQSPFARAKRKIPTLLPQALLLAPIRLDTCNCSG